MVYVDSFDCLPDNFQELDTKDTNTRYDGQVIVFGKEFQEKLKKLHIFLVGSGAIGCELLKLFAMMGIGASSEGLITITDMDSIEKSNLNRQFLFRQCNIGQFKSEVASKAIQVMNHEINIKADQNRVGPETENIYTARFFDSLDFVANALDNIDARKYVDRRCVDLCKPLFESGTLGTKANTQDILPRLTESYSSSQDPIEKSIPVCTIKSFPYEINHTIEWARELFNTLFEQGPKDVLLYANSPTEVLNSNQVTSILLRIKEVIDNTPHNFESCIKTAYDMWHKLYRDEIKQLLYQFPADYKTQEGAYFWSGAKKWPGCLRI